MTRLLNKPVPSPPELSAMTRGELLGYAREHSVEGISSSMRKADILETIKRAVG